MFRLYFETLTIFMKKVFYLSFSLLLCTSGLLAQDYLITTKGDSIVGNVKPMAYAQDKRVVVIVDKKKQTFPMTQVKHFVIDGELYKPAKGPTGYSFMKVLKEGYVSLLAYQAQNQTAYDGRYLLKLDGRGMEVPNLTFKKSMTNFMNDCLEVVQKLESGEFTRRDLLLIVDTYNNCITNKSYPSAQEVATIDEPAKSNAIHVQSWDVLKEQVAANASVKDKETVIEMIADIKSKLSRGEKVPNYLLMGLKEYIQQDELKPYLEEALKQLNP
jgi:hypothetical protein